MKTTQYKKMLKALQKAKSTTDIKPELTGVYIHEVVTGINGKFKVGVCTDSFRLHCAPLYYSKNLPDGIYNLELAQLIDGYFPDYRKIIPEKKHEQEKISLDNLEKKIILNAIDKDTTVLFEQNFNTKYLMDALELLKEIQKTYKYSDDITIIKEPNVLRALYIGYNDTAFALIMPLYK